MKEGFTISSKLGVLAKFHLAIVQAERLFSLKQTGNLTVSPPCQK